MNCNFIKILKNNNDIICSNSKNIFQTTTNYYRDFYDIKTFDEKIKKQILNYIIKKILSKTISKLKKSILL